MKTSENERFRPARVITESFPSSATLLPASSLASMRRFASQALAPILYCQLYGPCYNYLTCINYTLIITHN